MLRKLVAIVVVTAIAVALASGCNTMRGLGKDIERGGEKIQEISDK